ncbi:MAG: sulfatase-like hydrolase/transferase [Rhodocyclaceae bacterium]|nr:sulfatase-like hydrolase/transferase [Rhodocyclaceae bacterium]
MPAVFRRLAPYWEILAPLLLLIVNYGIFRLIQEVPTANTSWGGLLLMASPLLSLYCLARIVLSPLTAACLVTLLHLILSIANHLKFVLTTMPLQYHDLFAVENFTIIRHYLTFWHVLILLAVPLLLYLASRISPYRLGLARFVLCVLGAVLFALPALQSHLDAVSPALAETVGEVLDAEGLQPQNRHIANTFRLIGLPLYIAQTSHLPTLPPPSAEERQQYAALIDAAAAQPREDAPRNVLIVLCESCWYKGQHFRSYFTDLLQLGFRPFRGTSPMYGGGTVNASFELFTGLPVHNFPHPNRIEDPAVTPVTPILYQTYGERFSPRADTMVSALRARGYHTVNAHDFYGLFWKRNIVTYKLGFNRFYSIEDMTNNPAMPEPSFSHYPQDVLLFDFMLGQTDFAQANFQFLTTMYTHGPFNNEQEYEARLKVAMAQLTDYLRQYLAADPEALVLVFGDHLPAMNDYYYRHSIIPRTVLTERGFTDKAGIVALGDIPLFIHAPDDARLRGFLKAANGKPLYCISTLLDRHWLHSGHPVFTYAAEQRTCERYTPKTYNQSIRLYPDWLYAISLFDPPDTPVPAAPAAPEPEPAPEADPESAPAPQ